MAVTDNASFRHTGFVVNDIEYTAATLARVLTLSFSVWTITPESCVFRGQESPTTFRVALAQVGDSFYELIQPLTGDNFYAEHLKERGEGFHHTCFTYPDIDALHAARDNMLVKGRGLVQTMTLGASESCAFEIFETNAALELRCIADPGPPEKTIG